MKSIELILPFHLRLYLPSIVSSAGNFLQTNCHHLDERRDYRRLLVQLEETERRFDEFWNSHLTRLKQCLDLRRFEQDFRELQVRFTRRYCKKTVVTAMVCLLVEFWWSFENYIGDDGDWRFGWPGWRFVKRNQNISRPLRIRYWTCRGSVVCWWVSCYQKKKNCFQNTNSRQVNNWYQFEGRVPKNWFNLNAMNCSEYAK